MLINIAIDKTQVCLRNIFSKALMKEHKAAVTLISNHESRSKKKMHFRTVILLMHFEIAPLKNAFQHKQEAFKTIFTDDTRFLW